MDSPIRITAEDIFHRAADLSTQERKIYLDRACAGNDALRRDVEELLGFDNRDEGFLEKPVLEDAARVLAESKSQMDESSDTLREEEWSLGPYHIFHQLGKGGMGVVYLAVDTRDERQVAIKVLPKDSDTDQERLARFTREGRMLSELKSLKHPNIAEIYEQTEYDGKPCIVLEYVPGDTLADRLRNGPLPINEVLQYALQISDALKSAHDQHIVHRDLKPANIKITPEGKIKILDFGLAKRFYGEVQPGEEYNTRSLSLTESGMLIGTPAYMSPEQWNGQPTDQRADLWAFGCLLYEMLTGQAPFAGRNRAETMKAVIAASPDWNALPKATPLVILDLIRRCFDRNPANRLADAGEARRMVAEAVSQNRFAFLLFLKSQFWRLSRKTKRVLVWVVILSVVLLSLILARQWKLMGLVSGGIYLTDKDDLAAVLDRKMRGVNLELIRAALMPNQQSSSDLLALDDTLRKNQHFPEAIKEIIEDLNRQIKKETNTRTLVRLYVLLAQAHLFNFYLSSKPEDKDAASKACQKAQSLNDESFRVQLVLGELLNAFQSPDQAIAMFEKALQNPEKTNDVDALYGMAIAYEFKEEDEKAERFYKSSIRACENLIPKQLCDRYLNELGAFYFARGNYEQAEVYWEKVATQNQLNPYGYSNLGNSLLYQGCVDKAVSAYTDSINRKETIDGYSNRGTAYLLQRKIADAIRDFERVTINGQDLQDNNRPAILWGNLGDAYRLDGRTAQAIWAYRKAIEGADSQLNLSPADFEIIAMKAEWIAKLRSIGIQDTKEDPARMIEQVLTSYPGCIECRGMAVSIYYFLGDQNKAIRASRDAILNGYSAFFLRQNPDLEGLSQQREFQQIVQRFKSKC